MKLKKSDEKLINELALTKTVRELARVTLSYLTVEEMAKFISTYLVLRGKGEEDEVLGYFIKDQFLPLLKTFTLS